MLGLGQDTAILRVIGEEVDLVVIARGDARNALDGVGTVRGLHTAGNLGVDIGIDMHIDEVQVESRRVGTDGGPLHRDTLGEVNILILGRGSDADSCRIGSESEDGRRNGETHCEQMNDRRYSVRTSEGQGDYRVEMNGLSFQEAKL